MQPIRFSAHARETMAQRGAIEAEVRDAIATSPWQPVRAGRFECRKAFAFGREWNGRMYELKQVRPIFVDEPTEIVVVTVYAYYLPRGGSQP